MLPLRLAAGLLGVALVLGGCSSGADPTGASDGERLVLTPPGDGAGHTHAPGQGDATPIGDGTSPTAGGYRLADVRLGARPGAPGELSFRILDRRGRAVTEYVKAQSKLLHLYVVREDLEDFRHLHPTLRQDGTWSTRVDLADAGRYRVLAEFTPDGSERPVALGVTRTVTGSWRPADPPTGAEAGTGDDGVVQVEVEGPGAVGPDGRLTMLVSPVGDEGDAVPLGSYLGASAHLTGFRIEGGEFVHVHPYGAPEETDEGTRLTFHTTIERPGDYRFFLQVRVGGFLHTVPVTAAVE